jgi:uncharacterized protein YyaL (SSP411 family)
MEKECFEDFEVSEILNNFFVSIKVDREERPDVDNVYMSVCQAMTGSGGWPLTIIMTPDKKPFFSGTYFPKNSKYGYSGLMDILNEVSKVWEEDKISLITSSENIVDSLKQYSKVKRGELDSKVIEQCYKNLVKSYDNLFGGFGMEPKFPTAHNLNFLLSYWKLSGEEKALEMVKASLDSMYKGGIFDHIGFGFSRYSVDRKWLVPHFEKMLYDNALLAYAYLETYDATREPLYKEVAEKIFTYTLRDMTSKEGGFYSAEDADSEGEEGKFYIWSKEELENVLGKADGELYSKYYNITLKGNFEGKNIPSLINTDLKELENESINAKLEELRKVLFDYRKKRVHPHKDDKILTSWNGLMIAAMAYGGRVLENTKYTEAAARAVDFVFNKLQDDNGRLLARYRDGESAYLAYLDDYAFIVWGLIELYETTYDYKYLDRALRLNEEMLKYFWDEESGALFLYGRDSEQLIMKSKDAYDGAIPSGNSVSAMNMIRLFRITGDKRLEESANKIFKSLGEVVKSVPQAYSKMVTAFLHSIVPGKLIVISGKRNEINTENMLMEVNKKYSPFKTVIFNDESEKIHKLIPFIASQSMINNKATAYVCENYTCSTPTTSVDELIKRL